MWKVFGELVSGFLASFKVHTITTAIVAGFCITSPVGLHLCVNEWVGPCLWEQWRLLQWLLLSFGMVGCRCCKWGECLRYGGLKLSGITAKKRKILRNHIMQVILTPVLMRILRLPRRHVVHVMFHLPVESVYVVIQVGVCSAMFQHMGGITFAASIFLTLLC